MMPLPFNPKADPIGNDPPPKPIDLNAKAKPKAVKKAIRREYHPNLDCTIEYYFDGTNAKVSP